MIKNPEIKKYFNNSLWLIFDNIIKMGGGLFVGVWVARYLGAESYGILQYSISFNFMFSFLVNIGLGNIFIRELVKNPDKEKEYLGSAFGLQIIGAFFAFTLINTFSLLYETDTLIQLVIFIFSFQMFSNAFYSFTFYFQAKVISRYNVMAESIAFIISSAAKIYFILNEMPIEYIAIAYLIDYLLKAILKIYFYQFINKTLFSIRFKLSIAKAFLKDSWVIGATLFLAMVQNRIDQLMIKNMIGTSELGIYALSADLPSYVLLLPTVLINSLMPYFVDLKKNNPKFYNRRFIQILSASSWASVFVCLIGILIGEQAIKIIYAGKFEGAYQPFILNVWKILFVVQMLFINIWLVIENKQQYQLYTNSIGTVFNIIFNFIMITHYGIIGAAISTIMTMIVVTWISPFGFNEIRAIGTITLKSLNPVLAIRGLLGR